MKISETADGTIRVVELDPTKKHILVIDDDALVDWHHISLVDGAIILRRPGGRVDFVESDQIPPADETIVRRPA